MEEIEIVKKIITIVLCIALINIFLPVDALIGVGESALRPLAYKYTIPPQQGQVVDSESDRKPGIIGEFFRADNTDLMEWKEACNYYERHKWHFYSVQASMESRYKEDPNSYAYSLSRHLNDLILGNGQTLFGYNTHLGCDLIEETTQLLESLRSEGTLKQGESFKILDGGCGHAFALSELGSELRCDHQVETHGICLTVPEGVPGNIRVTTSFMEEMPYPDENFDFFISVMALCMSLDPLRALEEIYRVLKVRGRAIMEFTTPFHLALLDNNGTMLPFPLALVEYYLRQAGFDISFMVRRFYPQKNAFPYIYVYMEKGNSTKLTLPFKLERVKPRRINGIMTGLSYNYSVFNGSDDIEKTPGGFPIYFLTKEELFRMFIFGEITFDFLIKYFEKIYDISLSKSLKKLINEITSARSSTKGYFDIDRAVFNFSSRMGLIGVRDEEKRILSDLRNRYPNIAELINAVKEIYLRYLMENDYDAMTEQIVAHAARTAALAELIGRKLDLTEVELETLILGTLFHDLGKIDRQIINLIDTPGKLTSEQIRIVATHEELTRKRVQELMREYSFFDNTPEIKNLLDDLCVKGANRDNKKATLLKVILEFADMLDSKNDVSRKYILYGGDIVYFDNVLDLFMQMQTSKNKRECGLIKKIVMNSKPQILRLVESGRNNLFWALFTLAKLYFVIPHEDKVLARQIEERWGNESVRIFCWAIFNSNLDIETKVEFVKHLDTFIASYQKLVGGLPGLSENMKILNVSFPDMHLLNLFLRPDVFSSVADDIRYQRYKLVLVGSQSDIDTVYANISHLISGRDELTGVYKIRDIRNPVLENTDREREAYLKSMKIYSKTGLKEGSANRSDTDTGHNRSSSAGHNIGQDVLARELLERNGLPKDGSRNEPPKMPNAPEFKFISMDKVIASAA